MNTTRIAISLLLADGKSPLLTMEQQPQLKASKPQLVVQTGHADSVNGLAFSADGKLLASAGGEKTIKVWDAGTGTQLRSRHGEASANASLAQTVSNKPPHLNPIFALSALSILQTKA